ncbi:MAG: hypothetical protein H6797_03935 [Candidatus Nomurabacteria bacterium]|nr:MAG: hypothetical protein H6797_03935 [Candidatus Nomurabacteria bacterium]
MSWLWVTVVVLWGLDIVARIIAWGGLNIQPDGLLKDGERRLYVIPGVLAEAKNQISPLRPILSQWGRLIYVNWGKWFYSPSMNKHVLAQRIVEDRRQYDAGDIVLVASSLGGSVSLDVGERLHEIAPDIKPGLIVFDGIAGSSNLKGPGKILGPVVRYGRWLIPLGFVGITLLNLVLMPIAKRMNEGALPKDDEIEDGLNKKAIQDKARKDMAGYAVFTTLFRQTAHMSATKVTPEKLRNFSYVQYYCCTLDNVTVQQPKEARKWRNAASKARVPFNAVEVKSPHDAYAQMPKLWRSKVGKNLSWCFRESK